MKSVSAVTADRGAGYCRASHVEEDAGVRPFLESWKTRHEYGNGSKHFPGSDDRKEVHWIAKLRHHAVGVVLILEYLRSTAAHKKR